LVVDQEGGGAVIELPGQLGAGQACVQGDQDGAEPGQGVDQLDVTGAVAHQDGDALARLGREPVREAVRPCVELGEGEPVGAVDQGEPIRRESGPLAQPARHARHADASPRR
jgi:hypothetical protein